MSQNYVDTNTHLVINDMTEAQFNNLQSVDPEQLYLTEDESANQDLSNLSNAGKIVGSGLGMLSNSYDNLTIGTTGTTYTAPANGWFYAIGKGSNGWNFIALSTPYGNNDWNELGSVADIVGNRSVLLPVVKGQIVRLTYTGLDVFYRFLFYYAKGSESEAL